MDPDTPICFKFLSKFDSLKLQYVNFSLGFMLGGFWSLKEPLRVIAYLTL